MRCFAGLSQVGCGAKGVADLTASDAEHMDTEPSKDDFTEWMLVLQAYCFALSGLLHWPPAAVNQLLINYLDKVTTTDPDRNENDPASHL